MVAVLTVTALLALLLGSATLLARDSIDTARIQKDSLRAHSLLASGVALAGHQLFVLRVDPSALNNQQLRFNDGTVTLFVSAEGGKVDLNGADPKLLAAAYRVSKCSGMSPSEFAARVVDWRDVDDETSTGGAERNEYERAGLSYIPSNAPFRSIGELRSLLGISSTDVKELSPFLTISNPSGKVDPRYAEPSLLSAITGINPGAAKFVATLAGQNTLRQMFDLRYFFRGFESEVVLGEALRAYSVRVEATLNSKKRVYIVRAVVIASVITRSPYQITQWREQ